MAASWRLQDGQLWVEGLGLSPQAWPIDQGQSHTLLADDPSVLTQLAQAAQDLPGVTVLPSDGGLLSALTVGTNLALALSDEGQLASASWDAPLNAALTLAEWPADQLARLHRLIPADLSPFACWTLGWVVAYLRGPQVLVLDQPLAGLGHAQQASVLRLMARYHQRHKHGLVLWLQQLPSLMPPGVQGNGQAACVGGAQGLRKQEQTCQS